MSVIKIENFGGEIPRVSPRALPNGAAKINHNLLATSVEFRPLANDLLVVNALNNSNPKAIRRVRNAAPTAGIPEIGGGSARWTDSPGFASVAKGQVNGDTTERTYFTEEAGGAYVFDNTGFSKALGVPAPDAPLVEVTEVNEYSYDEDAKARVRIPAEMLSAVVDSSTEIRVGDSLTPAPTGSTSGWLPHETATSAGITLTTAKGEWVFLTPMSSNEISDSKLAYLTSTVFRGKKVTYLGGSHWAIPFGLQGVGYTLNLNALIAKWKAIETPDPKTVRAVGSEFSTERQQFTNQQVAEAAAELVADYSTSGTFIAPYVDELNTARKAMESALTNYDGQTTLTAMTTAFYRKNDVAAEITAAIANFAKSLVATEQGILNPPTYDSNGV